MNEDIELSDKKVRNSAIVSMFEALKQMHPHWCVDAIVDILAEKFHLCKRYTYKILAKKDSNIF